MCIALMIIFVNVITVLARVMQKIDLKITIGKIIKVSKNYIKGIHLVLHGP